MKIAGWVLVSTCWIWVVLPMLIDPSDKLLGAVWWISALSFLTGLVLLFLNYRKLRTVSYIGMIGWILAGSFGLWWLLWAVQYIELGQINWFLAAMLPVSLAAGTALIIFDKRQVVSKAGSIRKPRKKSQTTALTRKAANLATIPDLIDGRYEKIQEMKKGGMAIITLVKDNQTDLLCILKTPRYDTRHSYKINEEKLEQEAQYLEQLEHPNIVRFVDMFKLDNCPCLIVEYIEGNDLLNTFSRTPAAEEQVIKWACEVLDALKYIHGRGIVHRDLNPGNIMLNKDGIAVIIDFGTVKTTAIDGATIVSKPGFEVPEQVARGYADAKSDLCGLGNTMFYLLTSTAPGLIGQTNITALLTGKGVSERTAKCIAQAMNIDPKIRFKDAAAMRKALLGNK